MESITYFRNIKIAPKKLRFLIPTVKKYQPTKALEVLRFMPKRPAKLLYKAIHSALSNAKNTLKVNEDLLQFSVLSVDEGQKLKRYNPGSRGTAKPYLKRYSHIKVVLTASSVEQKAKKQAATDKVVPNKKSITKQKTRIKKTAK